MKQAIVESNAFADTADCPCSGKQGISIDGGTGNHLFEIRNDLYI